MKDKFLYKEESYLYNHCQKMNIKVTLQTLLLSVIAVIPFVRADSLYFPFVSGKAYLFRFLVLVSFFFYIWLILKDKERDKTWKEIFLPFRNILVIGLLFFFLAQIFVSFFGVNPVLSFFSTIERHDGVIQYGFWVLYFLMLIYAFKTKKDWRIFFSVFIIIAFLVSSYAWIDNQLSIRLHGTFGNPSYLAAYLIFAMGFCFIIIERKFFENKYTNILFWFLSLFFSITIFFTQTRGVYLGLGVAIFLFCLLSIMFLRKTDKKLVFVCTIILAIGLLSISTLFFARETNFVKSNSFLVRITEIANFWEVGSVRERVLNWQIALKAFSERPIFGYGPENFIFASNKYYDYRIGRGDPWFDRAHNQFLEYLTTGGIVLFSFYVLWAIAVLFALFKIYKENKLLSFILISIFIAYIVQGILLFDTLPVYLGLFPFLAFMTRININKKTDKNTNEKMNKNPQLSIFSLVCISVVAIISLFGIYATVLSPYRANASALQFLAGTRQGFYKEAKPFAEKAFSANSPYTYWEVRKRVGWQLLSVLDDSDKEAFSIQESRDLTEIYDYIVPELERFVEARPGDPQIYYVLSRIYRLGSEKINKNDLQKAEKLLRQSFEYSDLRVEYYNEIARVLLSQGKFDEGEALLLDYVVRVKSFPYFPYLFLGHYYYVAEKYELAFENYEKAKELDYNFCEDDGEYSRYIDSADKTKNYQELVDMSLEHIKQRGPNADIYFNVALGYYYLQKLESAREFFLKALELDRDQYQQYEHFFR
jgi:O-antigen ligase